MPPPTHLIDQSCVRHLFAEPARIAASAFLRREVAQRMSERLDMVKFTPDSLLDAGCGTGDDLLLLHRRYPHAHLHGTDLSRAMLDAAAATMDKMNIAIITSTRVKPESFFDRSFKPSI